MSPRCSQRRASVGRNSLYKNEHVIPGGCHRNWLCLLVFLKKTLPLPYSLLCEIPQRRRARVLHSFVLQWTLFFFRATSLVLGGFSSLFYCILFNFCQSENKNVIQFQGTFQEATEEQENHKLGKLGSGILRGEIMSAREREEITESTPGSLIYCGLWVGLVGGLLFLFFFFRAGKRYSRAQKYIKRCTAWRLTPCSWWPSLGLPAPRCSRSKQAAGPRQGGGIKS